MLRFTICNTNVLAEGGETVQVDESLFQDLEDLDLDDDES